MPGIAVPGKEETISMSYRATAFAEALPELAAPGCTPDRLAHLEAHGFVIITDFAGKPYFAQREVRGDGPEAYSEEIESIRWQEIQADNAKALTERKGVSMFLALVDDECHELIPGSHQRWRTPFEHDVLLPKAMKDQGVPY